MPRTRTYTRKELETLRRADLQRMYKRTEALIDELEVFFATPAAAPTSPARIVKPTAKPPAATTRQLKPIGARAPAALPPAPARKPTRPAPAPAVRDVEPVKAAPSLQDKITALSDRVQVLDQRLSEPSSSELAGDVAKLRGEVERLTAELGEVRQANVDLQAVLKSREEAWEARLGGIMAQWESKYGSGHDETPSAVALGKRRDREERQLSPSKRPRTDDHSHIREQVVAAARRSASPTKSPRTPSPTKSGAVFKTPELPATIRRAPDPRTPSPGHQGSGADNSATPSVSSDFFAGLPPPRLRRGSESEVLPFPLFATTPRPVAPTSPTTDAPPSASRTRIAASLRKPSGGVSHAHLELSTVTEGTESATPRVTFPPVEPRLLGPGLRDSATLSPSPSITESHFSSIPFPSKNRSTSAATSASGADSLRSSSPAREFMDVALHGLKRSPVAATPHRTLLGTERYSDTRFGDLPTLQWGTPTLDLDVGSTPRG